MTKITESEVLNRLTEVFRTHGYDGASLSKFSDATGLKRASLYHRFPGGKAEMAEAVLDRAKEWLVTNALAPLGREGPPEDRLRQMAKKLDEFYDGGKRSCLLDALSFGVEEGGIRDHQKAGMETWIAAIATMLRDSGIPFRTARERAEDAVIRIQGGLVLARVKGDRLPFQRTLRNLPEDLLRKQN
ncbi:MAG: TetR/AcrR family transcriptional regulator [Gemmatimonadota bacterium]